MRTAITVLAALLLVVGGAGLTGAAAPASVGGTSVAGQAGQAGGGGTACDYASLYDQTIGSVVAVRAGGGLGSGFLYDPGSNATGNDTTGYVVTNAHVVGSSETVTVQFAREESRPGTVVGRDRFTDLAVIRVNGTPGYAEPLPVAPSAPDHGQKVAALGNPLGLDETITHGIVSGLNRSLPTRFGFTIPNVVQTDAPISGGNSGGPLVTCDGTVVGVNAAGIASSRAENIAFAISPTLVRQVVPTLVETGEYEHAYLGISSAPIRAELAAANDLGAEDGAYVHRVAEGGPADGALQSTTDFVVRNDQRVPVGGDVIVEIDGQEVTTREDLSSYLVTETRPGETVTLTVIRDGERRQVEVTLGDRPEVTFS